jgi:hypothetical protein
LALMAPFVLLAAALLIEIAGMTWYPLHDFALLELAVRDIGTVDTPLVGAYSRYGWSHPGPMLTYVLAVPYRLTGQSSLGLLAGAVIVNLGAVVASIGVAWRRGGLVLAAWTALLVGLAAASLGADHLVSPWNPHVTVLPLVLFLLLAWAWSVGDLPMAPVAVAVGTVVVHGHVGYVVPVATALGYVLLASAWDRGRGPADSCTHPRRWWLAAGLVGLVLWLPAGIDQVAGSGNLEALARHFLTGDSRVVGIPAATRIAAGDLSPWGPWTGREATITEAFSGAVKGRSALLLLVPAGTLVGAYVLARRRGDRPAVRLVELAFLMVPATVVTVSRIADTPFTYLVKWTWGIAVFVWLAAGYPFLRAGTEAIRDRWSQRWSQRWPEKRLAVAATAGVAVLVAFVLVVGVGSGDAEPPEADRMAVAGAVIPDVIALGQEAGGPVLVRPITGDGEVFPAPSGRQLAAGLALQLERAGVPTRVIDQDWELSPGSGGARLFDDHRASPDPTTGTFSVVIGTAAARYQPPEGSELVVRYEEGPADVDIAGLEAELAEAFTAAGHPDLAEAVPNPNFGWVYLDAATNTAPDLEVYRAQVRTLLDAREAERAVVWWTPSEDVVSAAPAT